MSWLIKQYCNSRQWTKLAESTKTIARFNLRAVEDKWGSTPLEIAGDKRSRAVFLEWHDKLAEKHPRAADAKLGALARVLSWGADRNHLAANPVATFERAYSSDRSENIWLPEHVEALERVAGPEIRLAMTLALRTGQRQGDLRALTWKAWDGKGITLRQGKSRRDGKPGRLVYIPATAALKVTMEAAPRISPSVLTNTEGQPWAYSAFQTAWERAFDASGIEDDLHFHDLRGTAVTTLAEAGCTTAEIATITGHSQAQAQRILDRYLARTRTLAENAIAKLEEHRGRLAARI